MTSADDSAREIGVRVGDVVAGRYKVKARLGVGGMGAVVSARHLQLGGKVALKILLPKAAREHDAITRFMREARAMFHLKSEHAVKVLEVGTLPGGGPFLAMEYLEGGDIASLLARNGPFPPIEAVGLVLQACEAVAEAHSLGIVHRDIKPQNLFVSKRIDGATTVKVLDFGISKVPLESGEHMSITHSSAVMGTPLYMAPEQLAASVDADARSDIWAIGVVLYEMLTGRVPYDAPSAPALYGRMLSYKPPSPTDLNPDVPAELSAAVMRCLSPERRDRFDSVAALASALEPFAPSSMSGVGARLRVVHERITTRLPSNDAPAAAADGEGLPTQINWEGTTLRRKKTALAAAVGLGFGALAFCAAIVFARSEHRSSPAATETTTLAVAPVATATEAPSASASSDVVATSLASTALASASASAAPSSSVPRSLVHGDRRRTPPQAKSASADPDALLKQRTW